MNLLLDGIKWGMVLCLLIGPIFFALVQTGVEQGVRAGSMVGLGIWVSDLLYISIVYWGLSYAGRLIQADSFPLYLGVAGSAILLLFGTGTLLTPPAAGQLSKKTTIRSSSYFSLWLKGFLINTINPFTVFFWVGIMTTVVVKDGLEGPQASLFFGGILGTVILTDFLKVLLAKKIRRWLRPWHLLWMRRISGAALIAFGIVLLIRVSLL